MDAPGWIVVFKAIQRWARANPRQGTVRDEAVTIPGESGATRSKLKVGVREA